MYINFLFLSVVMNNINGYTLQFTHLSKIYEIYRLYYAIYITKQRLYPIAAVRQT